jgi:type I restriction enzyme M protein
MADQELLDDFLAALEQTGSPVKNPVLHAALGWDDAQYDAVKAELVRRGIVKRGRGRSNTVSLVGAEPIAKAAKATRNGSASKDKSLESWIWDAACSIRGAKDAPKYKDYILPLIFTKRLCDVFDDELNRIAQAVGSRQKAFQLVGCRPRPRDWCNSLRTSIPV